MQLVDAVKQMGRKKSDLTESQTRRMVGYLGNLDDMRAQIVVMVQRYENDEHVLKRLLTLIDRIDDVKDLIAAGGWEDDGNAPALSEKEITKQYDTPFNPLMVSAVSLLEASGLFGDHDEEVARAVAEAEAEAEAEADGADIWDQPTEDDIAALAAAAEDLPVDLNNINLRSSSINLPSLPPFPAPLSSSQIVRSHSHSPLPPPPPSNSSSSASTTHSSHPIRSRSVPNINGTVDSQSSTSDEEEESEDSDSGTGSSSSAAPSSSIPPPPPPPPLPRRKKTGPCPPVLCKICYTDYERYEELHEFTECGHQYCCDCLQGYLTTHIQEGAVLDLMCPCPDCETEILPNDIRALATPDIFQRYERFVVIASLKMDPNARWCPNPECNNGIKADPSKSQWVTCTQCRLEFCFLCMGDRHDGAACGKEALDLLEKRKASEILAQEKFAQFAEEQKAAVKPCPSCKAYIEKNDGCNHMTCGNPICREQFCWLCLQVYAADHFSNESRYPDCYEKQYWNPNDYVYARPARIPRRVTRRERFTDFAKTVGVYMGLGVAVVTLGVPAAVIGGPVYGCFKLHKRLKARRRLNRQSREYLDNGEPFTPPTPARIAEARREAARLRALEDQAFRR